MGKVGEAHGNTERLRNYFSLCYKIILKEMRLNT